MFCQRSTRITSTEWTSTAATSDFLKMNVFILLSTTVGKIGKDAHYNSSVQASVQRPERFNIPVIKNREKQQMPRYEKLEPTNYCYFLREIHLLDKICVTLMPECWENEIAAIRELAQHIFA